MSTIDTVAALEALYPAPKPSALAKESDRLHGPHRRMVEASPFCILATMGPRGVDCSPRGDGAGFVRVSDERTLLLPDRRGNNRIDSLRNIVANGHAGLIFLVPGKGEALRVAGTATISVDEGLRESFAVEGKPPTTVIVVRAARVFQQCARAIMRSKLWGDAPPRPDLPTAGAMMAAVDPTFDAGSYDASLEQRQRETLY